MNRIFRIFQHTSESKPCPVCHKSDMVIPIRYGYPDQKLLRKAKKGQIKLGGCCKEKPLWYCKRDDSRFS